MSIVRVSGSRMPPPMRSAAAFDPTYGFDREALLAQKPHDAEPEDLDAFWAGIAEEAEQIDPDPVVGPWTSHADHPGVEMADIRYRSLDGIEIGGWLTRPVRPIRPTSRALVVGHGYGGRSEPDLADVPDDAIAIFPVLRGLPTRSAVPGVGDDGIHHVLWGIHAPRAYSHIGSVVDTWLAAAIVRRLFPQIRELGYIGGSFGGGIGALAAGFIQCFDAVVLEVPSFGNHPWRVTVESEGSANRVRLHAQEHPGVMETLAYADAATAARRIHVPALVLPALADPVVPPPGQFAVAVSLAGPTWVHVLSHGHCGGGDGCDDERDDRASAISRFLADELPG